MRGSLDPRDNRRDEQYVDPWPRPPAYDWSPDRDAHPTVARPTFRTELLRIPMDDDPSRTDAQRAALRSVVTSILRASVDLARERDVQPRRNQTTHSGPHISQSSAQPSPAAL